MLQNRTKLKRCEVNIVHFISLLTQMHHISPYYQYLVDRFHRLPFVHLCGDTYCNFILTLESQN